MKKTLIIHCSLLIAFMLPLLLSGQSRKTPRQKEQYLEKLKAERKKEAEEKYKEALKNHYNMQSKETKKMMKSTFRKSQNEGKSKFFLKRWYDNIFRKRKMKENKQNGRDPHLKAYLSPPQFYYYRV